MKAKRFCMFPMFISSIVIILSFSFFRKEKKINLEIKKITDIFWF